MTAREWEYEYVGPYKRRRKVTPQMRALRERRQAGLRMATPAETKERLRVIAFMMADGKWLGRSSVFQLASDWSISVSRVEQLAAEAKRNG